MVASPLPFSPPQWRDSFSAFTDRGDWTPERLAFAREIIAKTCAENRVIVDEIRSETRAFLQRLVEQIRLDRSISVDRVIEVFENFEDQANQSRAESLKKLDIIVKEMLVVAPDVLAMLNGYRKEITRSYNELAAIHRDARWMVMAIRTQYQPSDGTGPIHGSGEPRDGIEAA